VGGPDVEAIRHHLTSCPEPPRAFGRWDALLADNEVAPRAALSTRRLGTEVLTPIGSSHAESNRRDDHEPHGDFRQSTSVEHQEACS
jgi:hypothetical protein